jgi:ABC-type nitrate/sulfonate/bicarbonate transport system permease component
MSRAGFIRLLVVAVAIFGLEGACRAGLIDPFIIIPPSAMTAGAGNLLVSGRYTEDILLTLGSVGLAAVLAIVGGFGLGYGLFRLPRLRHALDPLLASYYAVPTFIFYPLFIVLFGLNRLPLVAIGFVFAVVAMAINTLTGFERVPPVLRRTAKALRLSEPATLVQITMPACAPYLLTGAKLVIAYSFIGVIAGEFVLSGAGVGHQIAFAYNNFDNATMYGLMLLLIGFISAFNMLLFAWERRFYRRRGLT